MNQLPFIKYTAPFPFGLRKPWRPYLPAEKRKEKLMLLKQELEKEFVLELLEMPSLAEPSFISPYLKIPFGKHGAVCVVFNYGDEVGLVHKFKKRKEIFTVQKICDIEKDEVFYPSVRLDLQFLEGYKDFINLLIPKIQLFLKSNSVKFIRSLED